MVVVHNFEICFKFIEVAVRALLNFMICYLETSLNFDLYESLAVLHNIVDNHKQCRRQNIVQSCFYQP